MSLAAVCLCLCVVCSVLLQVTTSICKWRMDGELAFPSHGFISVSEGVKSGVGVSISILW